MQKVEEKEDLEKQLFSLRRNYELLTYAFSAVSLFTANVLLLGSGFRNQTNDLKQDLTAANAENKRLT